MRKQKEQAWNHEVARTERKERLVRLKDSSGGKKPIKRHRSLIGKIIAIFIAVTVVIGLTGFGLVRFGVPVTSFTAATIGEDKVAPLEINIYLSSIIQNQMQKKLFSPEGEKALGEPYQMGGSEFKTTRDFLIDSVLKQMRLDIVMANAAKKANYKITEEEQKSIDEVDKFFTTNAEKAKISVTDYLVQQFGPGASVAAVRKVIERSIVANSFQRSQMNSYTYDKAKIQKTYEERKNDIDTYTYRSFVIKTGTAATTSPEDKKKADEAADLKAEKLKSEVTTPDTFATVVRNYIEPGERSDYADDKKTLSEKKPAGQMESAELTAWLSASERKAGDKTILKTQENRTVYMFISRQRPEDRAYNVRHILLQFKDVKDNKPTPEQIAEAKARADKVKAEFDKGDKSEKSFGELAQKNSDDKNAQPGTKSNAENGGLYEKVQPGQMVPEFNNWSVDPARKAGDTTIVQTQYGFHIMYFISAEKDQKWETDTTAILRQADFTAWREKSTKDIAINQGGFGMKFVGPSMWTRWVYQPDAK